MRILLHEHADEHTSVEQIERDFDRDHYMSADEAKSYGIIDTVVTHHDHGAEVALSERREGCRAAHIRTQKRDA